jgi:hypothetical protein
LELAQPGGGLSGTLEHWGSTALTVAKDLGAGALNEAEEHPMTLLKNFAIGVAVGAAVVAVPELAIPMLAYGGYEAWQNRDKIISGAEELGHDVAVLNQSTNASSADAQSAEKSLEGFGALGADIGAGIVGGVTGALAEPVVAGAITRAFASGADDGAAVPAATVEVPATNPQPGATPSPGAPPTNPQPGATPSPGAPATNPQLDATPSPGAPATNPQLDTTPSPGAPAGGEAPGWKISKPDVTAGGGEATEARVLATDEVSPPSGDLRNVTDVNKFSSEVDKLYQAHQNGSDVTFQIDQTKPLVTAEGNSIFKAADGQAVVKLPSGEYTDLSGDAVNLTEQQVSGLQPMTQNRMLGKILADKDPENWHPNLVKPSPGFEPQPPESRFTAQQPAGATISNDGAPLVLRQPVNAGDERLPMYTADGKPLLDASGVQQTVSEIPANSTLSFGTIYDDGVIKAASPDSSVWATTPEGQLIRVTEPGAARSGLSGDDFVANENGVFGQPVGGKFIVVRNGAGVDPDGLPTLDAYPNSLKDINRNVKLQEPDGNQLGRMVAKPVVSPHYDLPGGMNVKITMEDGMTQTAAGAPYEDPNGFLWNPDSGYPNLQKVLGQTGIPKLPDGSMDVPTAKLVVASKGWNTQAGVALRKLLEQQGATTT